MKVPNFCFHCGRMVIPESEMRRKIREARSNGNERHAEGLLAAVQRERELREKEGFEKED